MDTSSSLPFLLYHYHLLPLFYHVWTNPLFKLFQYAQKQIKIDSSASGGERKMNIKLKIKFRSNTHWINVDCKFDRLTTTLFTRHLPHTLSLHQTQRTHTYDARNCQIALCENTCPKWPASTRIVFLFLKCFEIQNWHFGMSILHLWFENEFNLFSNINRASFV